MIGIEFVFRLVGMVLLAILGAYWGDDLGRLVGAPESLYAVVLALLGALVGLILTPFFTTRPARYILTALSEISSKTLAAGLIGMIVGLLAAALLAFPLSMLPKPFSQILPFVAVLLFSYLGVMIFVMRQKDIFGLFNTHWKSRSGEDSSEFGLQAVHCPIMEMEEIYYWTRA